MKTQNNKLLNKITAVLVVIMIGSINLKAQESKFQEIEIKTSAVCDDCVEKIETALAFEKGVKKASLDLETKMVTVTFNPQKISPVEIRKAIATVGYDADDVKADKKAYEKLPACCKKDVAPH